MTDLLPEKILSLPAVEAERQFNELSLSRQAMLTLMTPWEKRQELMLLSRNFPELVRSLPVEELFWTIKATGPEDCLQTIAACSCVQLQFIFDLDWWEKDTLRLDRITAWLILLFEAGEETANRWFEWIMKKDPYLVPAVARHFLKVQKRPDDMDIEEAKDLLYPFTIDNYYYIEFNDKLEPLWNRVVMKLVELDAGLYRNTMETILTETATECTEQSWRLRCGRLADFGLPDYFSALDIYAPLPPDQVHSAARLPAVETDSEDMPAFVPTLYMSDFPTITTAMQKIADSIHAGRIIREWTGVANKILMADRTDLDDPDALKKALFKTAAMINLGLEVIIDEHQAARPDDILKTSPLEDIVRAAMWPLSKIRSRARKIASRIDRALLPSMYSEQFMMFEKPVPLIWDKNVQEGTPFSRIEQVRDAMEMLDEIEIWEKIMERLAPHWRNWQTAIAWENTNFLTPSEFTWQHGLATALVNFMVEGSAAIVPVSSAALENLQKIFLSKDTPAALDRAADEFASISGVAAGAARHILELAADPVRKELLEAGGKTSLQGRYIASFLA